MPGWLCYSAKCFGLCSKGRFGVREVVNRLDNKYRVLIDLICFKGYTQEEVAQSQPTQVHSSSFIVHSSEMDLRTFIQSGLLEAYVLGQSTAEERALVERMAAEHAEVQAELASKKTLLERYAAANAVRPPDWMKASIMDRTNQGKPEFAGADVLKKGPGNFPLRFFQFLSFVLLAGISFLFLHQKETGRERDQLSSKTDALQQELVACNEKIQTPDPITELLCAPSTRRILVSDGKGIQILVYFNARMNRMAYDPQSLPMPKSGTYYQFWATVDEKPVSMGMQAANLCASMQTVENPVAFAISEESNQEGNTMPTNVLAVGKLN